MKKLLITIIFPVMLFVTGCSWLPEPHRIDIQQGNIISQDEINQLKIGMSKKQVLFIMGTPIIQDTFHPARWDYYYSLERGHVAEPTNHVILTFLSDQLITINGDMRPQPGAAGKPKNNEAITIIPKEKKVGLSGLIDSMINSVMSDDAKSAARPKTISKPQAATTTGQKNEKSGGFFDSFINFFKGDSSNKQKATGSPTKPTTEPATEQGPTALEKTIPGLDLNSFMNGGGSSDKAGDTANDTTGEVEPATLPDEPAPTEAIPAEQTNSDTALDLPDTSNAEQPAKPGQSWTGMNLDSFIKPYSDDEETAESPDTGSSEQSPPLED